ncbi:MAG: hypothetical protein KDN22_17080 [Verrucomicrobiae bacterium]|nr:hypothetical protein [Verrucomicrobiae bacterium]
MDLQVATLCDSATDYNGKLCVLGTFDTICAQQFPVIHSQCALALRLCFRSEDEGTRDFQIRIIDADGTTVVAIPPQNPETPNESASIRVDVKLPPDAYFLSRNLVFNLFRLKFDNPGQYSIDIAMDGRVRAQIPLRVMQLEQRQ